MFSDSEKQVHQLRTNIFKQMARTTDNLKTTFSRLQETEKQNFSQALTNRRNEDWFSSLYKREYYQKQKATTQ